MACNDIDPLLTIGADRPTFGMDMRGQTIRGSEITSGGVSIEEYNADFEAARKFLGLEKIAVLGYSPGGFFATHYALAHPDKVSALILAEPAIFTDTEDLIQRARLAEAGEDVRAMEAMLQYIDPSLPKEAKHEMAVEVCKDWQSSEIMGKVFRVHGERQITDEHLKKLAEVNVPILLIGGSNSPMNFHVKRIAAAVPTATMWWVRDSSHLDLFDQKNVEEIQTIVHRFLTSIEKQQGVVACAETGRGLETRIQ
jgi:pimeloyl-ACP methyl ester carboxylesterase